MHRLRDVTAIPKGASSAWAAHHLGGAYRSMRRAPLKDQTLISH
jgi:hypothetical protein